VISGPKNLFGWKLERGKQNFYQVWTVVKVVISFAKVRPISCLDSSDNHILTFFEKYLEACV
jgi:hypothetical protein